MNNNRRALALDDDALDGVAGGVGGGDSSQKKTVPLNSLSTNDVAYYLQSMCPVCKGALKSGDGGFCCESCGVTYLDP